MADGPTKEEFQALTGLVLAQGETIKSLQVIAWDQGIRLNAADVHVHSIKDVSATNESTSGPVAP